MAISFVQSATGSTAAAATTTATWPGNTTSGNMIICCVGVATNINNRVTDSSGNNYFQLPTPLNAFGFPLNVWVAYNIVGGVTPVITAGVTSATRMSIVAQEFSGLATVNPYDTRGTFTPGATASGTAFINSTAVATRSPNELLAFCVSTDTTASIGTASGYTNSASITNGTEVLGMQSSIVSTPGFQSASAALSASSHWSAALFTFADQTIVQGSSLNNFQSVDSADGISVTEKIR